MIIADSSTETDSGEETEPSVSPSASPLRNYPVRAGADGVDVSGDAEGDLGGDIDAEDDGSGGGDVVGGGGDFDEIRAVVDKVKKRESAAFLQRVQRRFSN